MAIISHTLVARIAVRKHFNWLVFNLPFCLQPNALHHRELESNVVFQCTTETQQAYL